MTTSQIKSFLKNRGLLSKTEEEKKARTSAIIDKVVAKQLAPHPIDAARLREFLDWHHPIENWRWKKITALGQSALDRPESRTRKQAIVARGLIMTIFQSPNGYRGEHRLIISPYSAERNLILIKDHIVWQEWYSGHYANDFEDGTFQTWLKTHLFPKIERILTL